MNLSTDRGSTAPGSALLRNHWDVTDFEAVKLGLEAILALILSVKNWDCSNEYLHHVVFFGQKFGDSTSLF